MRIRVADVLRTSSETRDDYEAILRVVTYTEYRLTFSVEMSNGRTYVSHADVRGCSDGGKSYESFLLGGIPVDDVNGFAEEIEAVNFPDIVFYDNSDEYVRACLENSESSVALWDSILDYLVYTEDRQAAKQKAIDNIVEQIIYAWSCDYFGYEEDGIEAYIQGMIQGDALWDIFY